MKTLFCVRLEDGGYICNGLRAEEPEWFNSHAEAHTVAIEFAGGVAPWRIEPHDFTYRGCEP